MTLVKINIDYVQLQKLSKVWKDTVKLFQGFLNVCQISSEENLIINKKPFHILHWQ